MAGDASNDPCRLEVIALPIVEPKFAITPPPCARQSSTHIDQQSGARQLSVVEGSRVDLQLTCLNKRLRSAKLAIDGRQYSFSAMDSNCRHWFLRPGASPLEQVDRPLHFEIQVVDDDGLQLPRPIDGDIRIETELPPAVESWADVRLFLPSGRPEIHYKVSGECGLSAISAIVQVQHEDGTSTEPAGSPFDLLANPTGRAAISRLPLSGVFHLPLSAFDLKKGDCVKVEIEAAGNRGNRSGRMARSEPILLQITDESGILAAIGQADAQAAQQLDQLIDRQLQVGGLK
jgi:hypothetical protein